MSISPDFWKELPDFPQEKEFIEEIFTGKNLRIERIASYGQASPSHFWYDQEENEWLLLISGYAELSLLNPDESTILYPGDFLFIPAHRKHRVTKTCPDSETLWLAVFFSEL
ncbi:MAG: cupin domain-containing protein [Candidatus Cloacimonetes bacterium]|nr:cupin domain-containing protein [Candidatus Cloacimonadota bacterium]